MRKLTKKEFYSVKGKLITIGKRDGGHKFYCFLRDNNIILPFYFEGMSFRSYLNFHKRRVKSINICHMENMENRKFKRLNLNLDESPKISISNRSRLSK